MLVHTCSHTLFVRARVCARDTDFTVLPFFYNLCQPLYMFTLVPEIHGWRCAIRVGESVIRVLRHGLCVGLFYCFNDTVCFIFMYFVRNDEIKTVNCYVGVGGWAWGVTYTITLTSKVYY